jgi:hypothetical protein
MNKLISKNIKNKSLDLYKGFIFKNFEFLHFKKFHLKSKSLDYT